MQTLLRDVMTWQVWTIRPETLAAEALAALVATESSELFVTDGQQLLGVLTDYALLKADVNGTLGDATAGQLMQRRLECLAPEDTIEAAAVLLRDGGLTRIPIVRDGRILGLVTRQNLLRVRADQRASEPAIQPPKFLERTSSVSAKTSLACG